MTEIEYAAADDTHIAYSVVGLPGRTDVVVVAGALFPFELLLEDRVAARFIAGLAALGRLVMFDKRGVGISDPVTDWSRSMREQWAEDLIAVMEAAALDRPAVVSWEQHGAARCAVAARPDLFSRLVLINPIESTQATIDRFSHGERSVVPTRTVEERAFPSRIHDEDFTSWLSRSGRAGASPTTAARVWDLTLSYAGALTPPGIAIPTLVLHNRDCMVPCSETQQVADAIDGARLVEVAGQDIYPISGDVDPLIAEIAEFLTGGPSALAPLRQVAAVLFTDVVSSTERAVDVGDARWRALLDLHDDTVKRTVRDHGGRVVKYTGDGVLALMPSATAALDGASAMCRELFDQGLRIRVGIHVGDVDTRGDDVSGLAVNIAARVMSQAGPDETLVSEATREAALGSRHRYEQLPPTTLKGIPGAWTLYRCIPEPQ
ncbi:MAG TPA: adenylate/guanylate cyclase domain-containing protein [Acidimicrobiia bacterium]|nr:adenylate/guanylate cyclase domain-containing protein [Acidimicrobiia bacterium]